MGDRYQAINFYNTAVTAINDTNLPDRATHAFQLFASACLTDPTWWEAPYTAGNNASDLNHPKQVSVACYRRALECQMNELERAKVLTNLGWKLHQSNLPYEALPICKQAIAIFQKLNVKDTGWAYACVNLSCIYQVLGDADQSLYWAQESKRLAPDDPTVNTNYAFALLYSRRLASGLKAFEARFAYELKNFQHFPYPRWEGEEDKTIYLIADQGLGDTLCYARWLPQAAKRCKYIHAYIQPELMRLFTHAFIDIPNLNLSPTSTPFPPADYWTTFVSLPFAMNLTDDEIRDTPWVNVPILQAPVNWKIPDRKYHIGIHWAGSPLNKLDPLRNIPVIQFLELYRVPGIQLYSLQVGQKASELHAAGLSPLVRDLVPFLRDAVDTASIIQSLDLVVAVESFLPHLCAAIGKECWMPYSNQGLDYRVGLDGTDRLWTPKHTIFKQKIGETWEEVFQRIVYALHDRMEEINAAGEGKQPEFDFAQHSQDAGRRLSAAAAGRGSFEHRAPFQTQA